MANSKAIDYINGYATVRSFGGMAIPVPVQNMILRNYVAGKDAQYILPLNEHKFEDCFMQFFATIRAVKEGGHIVMCSSFMLPHEKDMFDEAKKRILEKNITLHFVFDNMVISDAEGFEKLESFMALRNVTDYVDHHAPELREFLSAYV